MSTLRYTTPSSIPVVLLAYNRPHHTSQVLEALKLLRIKNLTIYCDGLKSEEHRASYEAVRKLVSSLDWIEPQLILHEHNRGLAESVRFAADKLFEAEEFGIVLEDDCVPQEYFLQFIFDCYQKYTSNSRVFGVSGYSMTLPSELLKNYQYDVYFHPRISSWGWATWNDRWRFHNRDIHSLVRECIDRGVNLMQGGSDVPSLIRTYLTGPGLDVWTLHWMLSCYLQGGFFLYPTVSHLLNVGFDGTGVHCPATNAPYIALANSPAKRFPEQVLLDRDIYCYFRRQHDFSGTEPPEVTFEQFIATAK